MFTTIATTIVSAAALVAAAPTSTSGNAASKTYSLTGVTHSVTAALGGQLRFDPDNIVAEVGDVVEWHFLPANHSIAESSFFEPCEPLEKDGQEVGFFAGFNFKTDVGQSENVFQIVVEQDERPIWFYCPQLKGEHCKNGMTGVINQNFDNQDFSLRAHRELAAQVPEIIVPSHEQGGYVIPNPNPNGGF